MFFQARTSGRFGIYKKGFFQVGADPSLNSIFVNQFFKLLVVDGIYLRPDRIVTYIRSDK